MLRRRIVSEALHLGAVVPAALGVCCLARDRGRLVELAAGLVMLVAMLDMALGVMSGSGMLASSTWAVVLVSIGGGVLLAEKLGLVPRCRHTAIGTALMGSYAAVMALLGHSSSHAVHSPAAGHTVLLALCLAVALGGSAVHAILTWEEITDRDAPIRARIAAGSMTVSMMVMLMAIG